MKMQGKIFILSDNNQYANMNQNCANHAKIINLKSE